MIVLTLINIADIYYGNWVKEDRELLDDFQTSLGDSVWWKMMKKYYYQKDRNAEKIYYNGELPYAKAVVDEYSHGKNLKGKAIPDIIRAQVASGNLPKDSKGVYVLVSSPDVAETMSYPGGSARFCHDYCGYHMSSTYPTRRPFTTPLLETPRPVSMAAPVLISAIHPTVTLASTLWSLQLPMSSLKLSLTLMPLVFARGMPHPEWRTVSLYSSATYAPKRFSYPDMIPKR